MVASQDKASSIKGGRGEEVTVLFVQPPNAKLVKTGLEEKGWIAKDFRMTRVTGDVKNDGVLGCIAIPIENNVEECQKNDQQWSQYVEGFGICFCPYSTAVLGNKDSRQSKKSATSAKLSLSQQALYATIQAFNTKTLDMMCYEKIKSLPTSTCPHKVEFLGDDRTLVLPPTAFREDDSALHAVIASLCSSPYDEASFYRRLWQELGSIYGSSRVAQRGTIDPSSRIRESGHRLLWTKQKQPESPNKVCTRDSSSDQASTPVPEDDYTLGWITVTEQGIRQSFDLTRIMFSRGNISEKIRFGKLVQEGDVLLDLYAGIGYYTLPALIIGKAQHVFACEWNPHSVHALRYNLKDNGVENKVTILEGDSRTTSQMLWQQQEGLTDVSKLEQDKERPSIKSCGSSVSSYRHMINRVSLGLLPSSEGGWKTAIKSLNRSTGGWLHIHGNVPVVEQEIWAQWVCFRLFQFVSKENYERPWVVWACHMEKVKSFAPTINHYVIDVFVGSPTAEATNLVGIPVENVEEMLLENPCGVIQRKSDGSSAGNFLPCSSDIKPPSCALCNGILHQDWMKEH